jgi:hypothetical protein
MSYVLNPKNGRVFKDGHNFSKMRGLVRISDDDAAKIIGKQVSASAVVGASVDAEAQAAIKETVKKAAEKAKAKTPSVEPEKPKPTVSISVSGDVAKDLQAKAEAEAAAEAAAAEASGDAFGGLTKDTVTIADVVAVPDEKLAAFSNAVLKLTQAPGKAASEIREQVMKIVAKQEEKRAKAK